MCMYCIDGTHLLYIVVCKSEHVQNAFYMASFQGAGGWDVSTPVEVFCIIRKINALSPCVNWCYTAGI